VNVAGASAAVVDGAALDVVGAPVVDVVVCVLLDPPLEHATKKRDAAASAAMRREVMAGEYGISPSSATRRGQNGAVIDLEAMLADLELLVNTESPSNELAMLDRSAAVLCDIIERRLGSKALAVAGPQGPHVHWSGGGDPSVLVVGHHDTVFPAGTVAQRPFSVVDGRATGPGVFDMKAGIVQAIHAIASLDDASGVELLITADEEIGSHSSRHLIVERALACGTVLVCEPSADGGALKIARKGTGTFELVVHGKASHAGLEPEKGINSLVAAAELVGKVVDFADASKGTTVTPTMAKSGTADNVVPALTRVVVDTRVEQPGEKERLESLFAELAAAGTSVPGALVELEGGINRPPMPASASASLFSAAVEAARSAGLGEVQGVAVGGGSDGNFTAAAGVPTLDGLGAVGGGAHADHEYVEVDTMVARTRLLAAILRRT
jgi:glutamate carboxypeptidase